MSSQHQHLTRVKKYQLLPRRNQLALRRKRNLPHRNALLSSLRIIIQTITRLKINMQKPKFLNCGSAPAFACGFKSSP